MRIGTDLDDCILNTSDVIFNKIEKKTGLKLDWNKTHSYNIEESFNLDKNLVEGCVQETLEGNELIPINGSLKIFNWLSEFNEMFIISKRRRYLFIHTKEQLDKLGFKNYRLFLQHPADDWLFFSDGKYGLINELAIDVFIEDSPEIIEDVYNYTKCKIFIIDRPWNKNISENERITIVKNWSEIRNHLSWN